MSRALPFLLTAALATGALAQTPQADPKARELLREAYEKRATWDSAFPGFQARLTVRFRGREYAGTARVGKDYNVQVQLPDAEAQQWAQEMLLSMASHRRAVPFERGDGRHPLTLGPSDSHASGRLVRLNDEMKSTYRVRDGQILQVNRSAGPRLRFTIDIVENMRTETGRFLPRFFTVSYFRADSGSLEKVETFADSYRKVGAYYLPESRRQVITEDSATDANSLLLDDLKLL